MALGAASLIAPELIWAKSPKKSLTILHTNDFHSRLEAFPANHKTFAGKGGIAQLKTVIDRETTNNSILLDCGDVFQGTPYFNLFGGKIEYPTDTQTHITMDVILNITTTHYNGFLS